MTVVSIIRWEEGHTLVLRRKGIFQILFENTLLLLLSRFRCGKPRGRAGATGLMHSCQIDAWRIGCRGRVHNGISNRSGGQCWDCRTNGCSNSNNICINKSERLRSGWMGGTTLSNLHEQTQIMRKHNSARRRNLRGVAMLVPLIVLVAVESVLQAEVIPDLGA